ncbi:hypothetical protein PCA20602_01626 [Pandoraea capi]|uniref:Uncharacterized protein n=1 Tax=Pandoraea capi TaxID=2508286 RepID=A0ABY6VUQ1_9BURK|nr:hypothetical protein [Pandoraea capi]VVD91024.1 hypothetical protein PCA20602_01626 [Pandoraea capi]
MSFPVTVTPTAGHAATMASRCSGATSRAASAHDAASIPAPAGSGEKSPRDSQTLSHAKRTLAVRREPPRAPDIERYLRRWLTTPPSVLIALASDDELLARNAAYPMLSPTSRRFGEIGYATYLLAQGDCGYHGTHLRTCIVSITQGCDVVTFPAIQAWADDGEPIIRAEALSYLHQTAERLKVSTPAQHMRRHDFYHTQMLSPAPHPIVVQSTHRTARLGMWLAATAMLERSSASLEHVLRDIRIGSTKFDPTFRQHQELARLARSRNRRTAVKSANESDADIGAGTGTHDREIAPSPLSRTFHDARPALFSQRCR